MNLRWLKMINNSWGVEERLATVFVVLKIW